MGLAPGARLGPYKILAPLGAGGMGEVWRAQDTRLGRDVAIKVLPDHLSGDQRALARFHSEARALAALSHPGILALYDVGRAGDVVYAVTELLEGSTLREALRRGRLPWREAVEVGALVAEGLEAAHVHGIVHRDLKPENVFLCHRDRVKILDFGLAKRETISRDAATESVPGVETNPGALVGTVGYISPEQLHGLPVDHRADIFALGCVLYEMLSGHRAFTGRTASEVIAAILHDEPSPLNSTETQVPTPLGEVVARCLNKDPAGRFGSARDVAFSLRAFLSGSAPPARSGAPRRPARTALIVLGGLAAAAVGAVAILQVREDGGLPPVSPRQVTNAAGYEGDPAISPDGEAVAFVADHEGIRQVWVADSSGGRPLRLTEGTAPARAPAWLPDGKALVYEAFAAGQSEIRKVPRFGGPPQTILTNASDPAISPDGRRIAFSRADADGSSRIWLAPPGQPDAATPLTTRQEGAFEQRQPVFSPDGTLVCYRDFDDLWVASTKGGPARRLTHDDPADFDPAFSADGRHVYFASYRGATRAIWRVAEAGGPPERVTFGAGAEVRPSLSRDGRRMAYATLAEGHALVLVDPASGARVRVEESRLVGYVSLERNGRFAVYTSSRENTVDLWRLPLAGGKPAGDTGRLTELGGHAAYPAVSPDGRFVAFHFFRNGQREILVVPSDGGKPQVVAPHAASDFQPAWSPDGKELTFVSDRDGSERLWSVAFRDGRPAGEPRCLSLEVAAASYPRWMPDGRHLVAIGGAGTAQDVVLLAVPGGMARQLTSGVIAYQAVPITGGRNLLVLADWERGRASVRSLPLEGGTPAKPPWGEPSDLATEISAFDATPGDHLVALVEETVRGDVWVLETLGKKRF